MAEALKNQFGPEIPERISTMISAVEPSFDGAAFVGSCLVGYDDLELTARARHIAAGMAEHLPTDRDQAMRILVASLDVPFEEVEPTAMSGFVYLPHVFFVADHGLDHFETAMEAQYLLTQRFTAEFSIRSYLEHHRNATLERLRLWASDPNVHVRRLVSEGTRPRLPWAPRLREFQADPGPVLELLELLKDDDEEYVRRSVANNLNDIAKDHPDLVVEVAGRWWADADSDRRRLIRHGLRTLVKQGDPAALAVLGYGPDTPVEVRSVTIEPGRAEIGGKVVIEAVIANPSQTEIGVLVDLRVHFVKANGTTSPKVFKGKELVIEPGGSAVVRKTISLSQHSTRTHYAGVHRVELIVNGTTHPGGDFELRA